MADTDIPNHVSIDENHSHYWRHYKHLGVRIDGEDRPGDVHEFNVAEGWAMVRQRNDIGQFKIDPQNTRRFLLMRVQGQIEPYLKRPIPVPAPFKASDQSALDAAAAKRARKAEKLKALANG